MAPKRRCPICRSKKWHKEPSSGIITCSEGHVLQDYRNETIETTEFGPHAMRKRNLKSTRVKKEKASRADPILYHGDRARFHYFQCLQVILRMQIKKITELWKLPPEYEIVCRDTWALHLSLLINSPPAEPYHHTQDQSDIQQASESKQDTNVTTKDERSSEDDDSESIVKLEGGSPDSSPSSSGSDTETEAEDDPEMAELLREASESEEDSGNGKNAGIRVPEGQGVLPKKKKRWRLDDSPAGNIAVLMHACWTMRIPVIYKDFIDLIETYTLPYLDPVRLLHASLTRHLTKHTKSALSPHFAPTTVQLHALTSRLARSAFTLYGIFTPELNAAPVLWRAVRHMGGNASLYVITKQLARFLELPLTVNPAMAPPALQRLKTDPVSHKSDNVPPEVALTATTVIGLKLIYGLDGKETQPAGGWDPAHTMPSVEAYLTRLRELNTSDFEEARSTFSLSSVKSCALPEYDEKLLDGYLSFCERALLGANEWKGETRNAPVQDQFPIEKGEPDDQDQRHNTDAGPVSDENARTGDRKNGAAGDVLVLPAVGRATNTSAGDGGKQRRPGELYAIYSTHDLLGTVPAAYELVVGRAARFTGVSVDDLNAVVERFERRLVRLWKRQRRRERLERAGETYVEDEDVDEEE